jgi:hypothetical protein
MNVHVEALARVIVMVVEILIKHFVMVIEMVMLVERQMYKHVLMAYMVYIVILVAVPKVMVVVVAQLIRLSYGLGIRHLNRHVKNYIKTAAVLQII